MLKIFSIIASMRNELGHFYEYNLSLSKAIKLNSWNHIKIIPRTCDLNLDESWQKVIYEVSNKNKLKNFKNIIPFIKVFKKIKNEKDSIIFVEDFNLSILLLILIALIFVRPKTKLFLFHRFEYFVTFLRGRAYKFIHYFFEKILGKGNVKYLTDSELIAKLNGEYFSKKFLVFPIPHTDKLSTYEDVKLIKNGDETKNLWWPGGLIREEKGLKSIQRIISLIKQEDKIKIIMAEAAKDIIKSDHVVFIPTYLTRKEYEKYMINSDMILLPYVGDSYRYKTSGIFVEAICFGNIPIVSDNTWMAYELKKFNLNELIFDFDEVHIIKKIHLICTDDIIKQKVKLMKSEYIKKHSIANFSIMMKELVTKN
jgi:hypothetical protein